MHTPKISPYREWLRSYVDDIPNDYKLLGIADFEPDKDIIARSYQDRLAELDNLDLPDPNAGLRSRIAEQLEAALNRLSDPEKKARYDSWLLKTGRAGLPNMGWSGRLAITFAFIVSCGILTASVYLYPVMVKAEPVGKGDSIKTLAGIPNNSDGIEGAILVQGDVLGQSAHVQGDASGTLTPDELQLFTEANGGPADAFESDPLLSSGSSNETETQTPVISPNSMVDNTSGALTESIPDLNALAAGNLASDVDAIPVAEIGNLSVVNETAQKSENAGAVPAENSVAATTPKTQETPVSDPNSNLPATGNGANSANSLLPASIDFAVDSAIPEAVGNIPLSVDGSTVKLAGTPTDSAANVGNPFEVDPTAALDNASESGSQAVTNPTGANPAGALTSVPPANSGDAATLSASSEEEYPARVAQSNPAIGGRYLVPSESELKDIYPEIISLYKLSELKTPKSKANAARKMLADSVQSQLTAEKRFALLERAIAVAGDGRDAELALQCVIAQSRMFVIDLPESAQKAVCQSCQGLNTADEAIKLVNASLPAINFCIKSEDYSRALTIAKAVYQALNHPNGREYRPVALQRLNEIASLESQWAQVVKAKQDLAATDSDSCEAADIVARWYCEVEQDWNQALPYLLRSTNGALKQIALKENISCLSDALACMEIGNLWWNYSQNQTGPARKAYQFHAVELYKNALPGLDETSLDYTRIQKRLEDAQQ